MPAASKKWNRKSRKQIMLPKPLMRLPGPPPRPVRTAAKFFQHGGSAEDTVITE